ncbi:MAG: aminotransferase class I/II-fold pyridoxal phosphate-dependent enzyme [Clostridiales bacterium]|nr:aminotransferase class I/II-fold pyridoxal phosphate-dependent enzyme [Clostridiales bacterium]
MSKIQNSFHGSDLEKVESQFGIKKESLTNFAANVNPLGISPKLRQSLSDNINVIESYPDREYTSLRQSIADYAKTSLDKIFVGNGSTELISIIIQIRKPKKACIIGPTYSEYEREVILGGGRCQYFPLKASDFFKLNVDDLGHFLSPDFDLLIICNPNNPTSTAINTSKMRKILDICKEKDILCMVDETYVEFVEDIDEVSSVALTDYYNNLIVLRGISKFFAAPGLRLGYGICGNKDLIEEINRHKNPWSINSLAAIAGEIMFSDSQYIDDTRRLIKNERERIYKTLSTSKNLKLFEPTANFILVQIQKHGLTSSQVFEQAIKKGFMIRDCSTFPFLDDKFIRFCFMDPESNTRLMEFLLNL